MQEDQSSVCQPDATERQRGDFLHRQVVHTEGMKYSHGVTIVELLVTLVVLAILAALAVPSFVSLIRDSAVSNQLNSLNADIRYARSDAIKRGLNVTLCPSASPLVASPTCSGSDWSTGWIVFVDTNGNNTRSTVASDAETVLRRQEPFGTSSNGITGLGGTTVSSVRFNSDGRSPGGAANLEFRSAGNEVTRILCISITGRPRAADKGATAC